MNLKKFLKQNYAIRDKVFSFINKHYDKGNPSKLKKCRNAYGQVWDDLLKMRAKKADFCIAVELQYDEDESWFNVHGIPIGNTEDGETWAIEMTDWREWLGAEIDSDTLSSYHAEELIGHILWEMTFCGFTNEEILGRRKELIDLADRVDKGLEPLYSMDVDENGEIKWTPINTPAQSSEDE